jgi:hypothetical protein
VQQHRILTFIVLEPYLYFDQDRITVYICFHVQQWHFCDLESDISFCNVG